MRHSDMRIHNGPGRVPNADAYQLVFESLPLDEIIHAVGAVRVRPANFVDRHAAEASASQRQPSAAGVIASHDHCSHTCITVTVKANTHQHIINETFRLLENQNRVENGCPIIMIMTHTFFLVINCVRKQKETVKCLHVFH